MQCNSINDKGIGIDNNSNVCMIWYFTDPHVSAIVRYDSDRTKNNTIFIYLKNNFQDFKFYYNNKK